MGRPRKYAPEFRERGVRMVHEHAAEHPSQWAATQLIATNLGCTARRCGNGCGRTSGIGDSGQG